MRRRHELTITEVTDLLTNSTDFALTLVRERSLQEEDEQEGRGISIPWPALLAAGTSIAGLWTLLHKTDEDTPIPTGSSDEASTEEPESGSGPETDTPLPKDDDEDGSSLLDTVVNWLKSIPEATDKQDQAKTVPQAPSIRSTSMGSTFMGPVQDDDQNVAASYIKTGAAAAGIDPALPYAVGKVESGLNVNASNKLTGATGIFQFLPSTWRYLISKYRDLGFTMEDIRDPKKNAIMGAVYLKQIATSMGARLGRKPSPTEIYLGHFLGLTGGLRFIDALTRTPDADATALFASAAKTNPGVFYDADGKPRTIRQVWDALNGKIAQATATYVAQASGVGNQSQTENAPAMAGEATNQTTVRPTVNAEATPVAQTVSTTMPAGSPTMLSAKVASRVALTQVPFLPDVPGLDDNPMVVPMTSKPSQIQKTYVRTKTGLLISIPVQ